MPHGWTPQTQIGLIALYNSNLFSIDSDLLPNNQYILLN